MLIDFGIWKEGCSGHWPSICSIINYIGWTWICTKKKAKNRNPVCGQTDFPRRGIWLEHFFISIFLSGSKNDFPERHKNSKKLEKYILSYFQKKFRFLWLRSEMADLTQFSQTNKEKILKWKIWVGHVCTTGFAFCMA